jgi:hypothetical protein
VAPFRIVRDVHASPGFPHALHITVVEQLPVAALLAGGTRTAVAADGVVLGPALLSSSLPTLAAPSAPAAGQRLGSAAALAGLTVLGAAPRALLVRAERVFSGPRGLTVAMRNGLLVYFGDGSLPHAKWLALAAVLADPSSPGASYVDVRLPSRPAAGFPGGAPPATAPVSTAGGSGGQPGGSRETTIGALAEGLGGGGTAGTASSGGESGEPSASGGESEASSKQGGGEATSGAAERAAPEGTEAPQAAPEAGG